MARSMLLPGGRVRCTTDPRDEAVVVFVERGEFDTRIGTAPAGQRTTLPIPESIARQDPDIEIFVHPERGMDLASQHFKLKSGAHLLVKVPVHAN